MKRNNMNVRTDFNFVYHLADHCNLNCKGCDHFSPIAEEYCVSAEKMEKEFARLGSIMNDKCIKIGLMGGEPLLNPDINKCLVIARKYFTKARIRVVSNGLILDKMPKDFWKACHENNVEVEYTKYPLKTDYETAENNARQYDVKCTAYGNTGFVVKSLSKVPFDLSGNQDIKHSFLNCWHANDCIQLKDGKIFTCTVAANAHVFAEKYDIDIKVCEDDYIDIWEEGLTAEKILKKIASPIPFCRYCDVTGRSHGHSWHVSNKSMYEWIPFKLDDRGIAEIKKENEIVVIGDKNISSKVIERLSYMGYAESRIKVFSLEECKNIENKRTFLLLLGDINEMVKNENILHDLGFTKIFMLENNTSLEMVKKQKYNINHCETNSDLNMIMRKNQKIMDTIQCLIAKSGTIESLEKLLLEKNISSVIIYGYGVLGKVVYRELENSGIKIKGIMDGNINGLKGVPSSVCLVEKKGIVECDAVLVTALNAYKDIYEELSKIGYKNVLDVSELIGTDIGELSHIKTGEIIGKNGLIRLEFDYKNNKSLAYIPNNQDNLKIVIKEFQRM